jgi:hypothetical protein
MYFDGLKEKLKNKTLWVVVEVGEWHCIAVEVFTTQAEAFAYMNNPTNRNPLYDYKVVEQSIGEALTKFDERVKAQTIREEAEAIAKEVDWNLRNEISSQIYRQYNDALKPIEDAIHRLQYKNFRGE